jgi:SAM-dependent methyltransferase
MPQARADEAPFKMSPVRLLKETVRSMLRRHPWHFRIRVTRTDQHWDIDPRQFLRFAFERGDKLTVLPAEDAKTLHKIWGDTYVPVAPGRAIRVPAAYDFFEFKGFRIPVHLIWATGNGPDTLDALGQAHINNYRKFIGLSPDMSILELGCGIGRDAYQLFDVLDPAGRYVGVDVSWDSIEWCLQNITARYPNFKFYHFDAYSEVYNPYGTKTSMDFRLPVGNASVDRIVLTSVFTHLLEDEVLHYMHEFRRVLKPDGLIYANFFLYSKEALAAAKVAGITAWKATFEHSHGDGVYGNDPDLPRGVVAYTDEAMRRMIGKSGLRLKQPYLKGSWSGLHEQPDDGQDVAILGI